eukprot:11614_1
MSNKMNIMSDDLDELLSKNSTISRNLRDNMYNYIELIDDDVIAKSRTLSQLSKSLYYEQKAISKTFITAIDKFVTSIDKIDFNEINNMIYAFYEYIEDTHKKITNIVSESNSISVQSVNICKSIVDTIQQENDQYINIYDGFIMCDINVFSPLQVLLSVDRLSDNEILNNISQQLNDKLNYVDMNASRLLNNIKINICTDGMSIIHPGACTSFVISDQTIKYKSESEPNCFRKYQMKFQTTLDSIKRHFIDFSRKYK